MPRRLGRLLLLPIYLLADALPEEPNFAPANITEVEEDPGLVILGNALPHRPLNRSLIVPGETRTIMVWAGGFGNDHLGGCPDWGCKIIGRKEPSTQADALIFHNGIGVQPKSRSPDQLYVFFTQESPLHSSSQSPYPGFFNLTMGFRRDADLPCPYGYAMRRDVKRSEDEMRPWKVPALTATKSKMAAWFSSNCHAPSGRDRYVAELSKHISVDIYGACGPLKCPKANKDVCLHKLRDEYRFYLAFENSLCKDYVTEKYWEKAATLPIIPVVLKRSLLEPYAPPHSFLAADDFASPAALAAEMKRISEDPQLFASYFTWKKDLDVIFLNGQVHDMKEQPWGFCRLCAMLWEQPKRQKIYTSLKDWWQTQAHCEGSDTVNRLLQPQ